MPVAGVTHRGHVTEGFPATTAALKCRVSAQSLCAHLKRLASFLLQDPGKAWSCEEHSGGLCVHSQ